MKEAEKALWMSAGVYFSFTSPSLPFLSLPLLFTFTPFAFASVCLSSGEWHLIEEQKTAAKSSVL